jgi:hypothetical protein
MAEVILNTVSIALLLAGKIWRNLPAVYFPLPRQSDPSTRQIANTSPTRKGVPGRVDSTVDSDFRARRR